MQIVEAPTNHQINKSPTNHHVYFISAALSLFGDLLVPPQFACNLI